jgi:hypothetical protein
MLNKKESKMVTRASTLEIALKMENFAPANYLGEFIDMPTTDDEAGLVRYVKHIYTGKLYEVNQVTRQVNHNIEWKLNKNNKKSA